MSQIRTLEGVRYYQVSCPISPGDSGGPVLNERGEAIGVMSWRKAGDEHVSFAIPGSDIRRLNASGAPTGWPEGALGLDTPVLETGAGPRVRREVAADNQGKLGQFIDFQHFLAGRSGKRLTVTVQEDGKQSRFTFDVPAEATKWEFGPRNPNPSAKERRP